MKMTPEEIISALEDAAKHHDMMYQWSKDMGFDDDSWNYFSRACKCAIEYIKETCDD